ncbi:hypothetical protein J40TS1_37700 [Paenibacillus montaniterrae]|uniref:Noncanonical pyrimidine nucleotidase, YjjG family n=1 Tax=Paenibacillus montaniterrae TaxID=429341 RepID=A0A920D039_9BACL|nr:hypothetical protein [Paenibacillus montaniterrae]GIP18128.1 hypothetical protein J40TS1_37700 [Paenibacillus montaniterrae]
MQYEIILFDADDTLFDYVKAEIYALTNTFEEFGVFIMPSQLESYRKINQLLWDEYEKGAINLGQLRTERFRRLFIEYNLNLDSSIFSEKDLGIL